MVMKYKEITDQSVLEPETFGEAQERDMIIGTGEGRDGIMYLVTRHTFTGVQMSGMDVPHAIYGLHEIISLGDRKVRPDDRLSYAGGIDFILDARLKDANLAYAGLQVKYRGQGLGLLIYKAAINDLVDRGYTVQSDYIRTPEAERVWRSIMRDNPESVDVVIRRPRDDPALERALERDEFRGTQYRVNPTYYSVYRPVGRRPVRVRGHRRTFKY